MTAESVTVDAGQSLSSVQRGTQQRTQRGLSTGRLWAWAPALLLGGLLGSQLVVLSQVLEDPGYAVERDYYRKAVSWDAERARELQSQALGWRATCEVTHSAPRYLSIDLADARGLPVTGAELRVEAFHNARAGHVLALSARELTAGRYEAPFDARRSGAWELRIHAKRGGEAFTRVVRIDLRLGEGS